MICSTLAAFAMAASIVLAMPTRDMPTRTTQEHITLPMIMKVRDGEAGMSWMDLISDDEHNNNTKRAGMISNVPYQATRGAYFYAVPLSVGSPSGNAISTVLQIDTGSADIWSNKYKGVTGTDPAAFNICYGSGGCAVGTAYTDSVTVGGLTATGMRVAATDPSDPNGNNRANADTDGIFGMSWGANSRSESVPYVQQLFSQSQIPQQRFGSVMKLKPDTSGAELYLGGVDTSRLYSSLTTIPINYQAFWEFNFDGMQVGSAKLPGGKAYVDTGSVFIIGPNDAVQAIYDNIPGYMKLADYLAAQGETVTDEARARLSSNYALPCGSVLYSNNLGTRYTTISVTIAGRTFVVPYVNLVGIPTQRSIFRYLRGSNGFYPPLNGQYYCDSLLLGTNAFTNTAGDARWNFGVPFQYHLYVDYNYDGAGSVGFDYSV